MARLKGFTISESIIAMTILSIIIAIGSYFTSKSLSLPTRTTLIESTSLLNAISKCETLSDFQNLQPNYQGSKLVLSANVTEKTLFADVEFSITHNSDTLFTHFIVLRYEN